MSRAGFALPHPTIGRTRRARLTAAVVAVVVAGLAALVVFDPPWVIEDISSGSSGSAVAGSANLSPDKYVNAIWASKLLPTVKKDAVDFRTLLAELKRDPDAASKKFGHYTVLDAPPAFLVKGTGRVISVDTAALVSKAGIALGQGSKPDVFMELPPIFSGTDVRDALPFINFNQFENQVQYGEVAIAINAKIAEVSFAGVNVDKLKGKRLAFTGAFTRATSPTPLFTPITIKEEK